LAGVSIFATATGFGSGDAVLITAKAARAFFEGEHGVSFSRVLVVQDLSIETRSVGGQSRIMCGVLYGMPDSSMFLSTMTWAKVTP
jgi:hypothetical protein